MEKEGFNFFFSIMPLVAAYAFRAECFPVLQKLKRFVFLMLMYWDFAGGCKDIPRRGDADLRTGEGRAGGESRGRG